MSEVDLVQLMYSPSCNHLHNSKLSAEEHYGYYSLGVLERDKAFEFGGWVTRDKLSIEQMREWYKNFIENTW